MKRLPTLLLALTFLVAWSGRADAALTLQNGNFDGDPDLGGADDAEAPPTGWFVHYTIPQSWSDFRFGNNGNGAWVNNGIAFGQNFLGPNFDPGPEDGFYYTSLGVYGSEVSALVSGFGYNRINGNPAGGFDVGLYFTPGNSFLGANGTDVAASAVLLGSLFVDISTLTGPNANSQAFNLSVLFAGSGIHAGDRVWLRLSDGPDNGDLGNFDEPIIDNLQLVATVPEPSSAAMLLTATLTATGFFVRRSWKGRRWWQTPPS